MVGFGGGIPAFENSITLDETVDRFGMRQAKVVHRFTEEQTRLAHFMLDQGREVMHASGARESWSVQQGAGHLIGGTIIGREASESVADSWGALHEVPNVYVTGAGLFPASGGASPTFTVEAWALRTAEHLKV